MLPPTTQEEIDRRDSMSSKVQLASDIINMLSNSIEDPATMLKVIKLLLSNIITDTEIIDILQEQIEAMKEEDTTETTEDDDNDIADRIEIDNEMPRPRGGGIDREMPDEFSTEETGAETSAENSPEAELGTLPSPSELGVDLTDNTQF